MIRALASVNAFYITCTITTIHYRHMCDLIKLTWKRVTDLILDAVKTVDIMYE